MGGVALRTTDVVPPMLAAPEIIVSLFAGMTGEARFGCRLRVHALERNYFGLIAATLDMCLARTVTRFTTYDFSFPGRNGVELAVLCPFEALELRFMTGGTCFASDVVVSRRDRTWTGQRVGTVYSFGYRTKSEPDCQRQRDDDQEA